jgi:sulfur relay (sulfurtransferase) DsrF/TusC family protein
MEKNVVVIINHAPHGSIFFLEGLRAAMGLIASTDELNITILFLGEGVWGALSGLDRGDGSKYIATMAEWGFRLNAESESLAERGINTHNMAQDVEIIQRSQAIKLLHTSDFTLSF